MRISDWSSDVCSSDLISLVSHDCIANTTQQKALRLSNRNNAQRQAASRSFLRRFASDRIARSPVPSFLQSHMTGKRSEEHTSELQSLIRISYAAFCLQKKKSHTTTTDTSEYYRKMTA